MNIVLGLIAAGLMAVSTSTLVEMGAPHVLIVAGVLLLSVPIMCVGGYVNPADWWKTPFVPTLTSAVYLGAAILETYVVEQSFQETDILAGSQFAQMMYFVCGACWVAAYGAKRFRRLVDAELVAQQVKTACARYVSGDVTGD
jgi:hypothetical protein